MSESSVFILGAGTSAEAGAPLMGDFLRRADDLRRASLLGAADDHFCRVARGQAVLQQVLAKARMDINNLETVFAAFEMARLFGGIGTIMQPDEAEQLVPSMQRVIVETLDRSMNYPVSDDPVADTNLAIVGGSSVRRRRHEIQAPSPYPHFAQLINKLRLADHDVTLITFNYDLALDVALWRAGVEFTYGLDPTADQQQIPLLKLHGSLNWASCTECRGIVVRLIRDVVGDAQKKHREAVDRGTSRVLLGVAGSLTSVNHCEKACAESPVIVPPTFNKAGHHQELAPVWRRAADALSSADNVFVLGYSWPRGDHFFHQLYALGSVGERLTRRFWVFNPDKGVIERFRDELLGQLGRDAFGPRDATGLLALDFRRAITHLKNTFGIGGLPDL